MKNDVKITTFIPADRATVFRHCTTPELLEQWSSPEGMTLVIPYFEARLNGKYRYEHTGTSGRWVSVGHLKEFVLNEKMVMVDTVTKPDGTIFFENVTTVIDFRDGPGGTEITINQGEFPDDTIAKSCEQGWNECFSQLEEMITASSRLSGKSDQFSASSFS